MFDKILKPYKNLGKKKESESFQPYKSLLKIPPLRKKPKKESEKEVDVPLPVAEQVTATATLDDLSKMAATPKSLKFAPLAKLLAMVIKDMRLLMRSKSSSLIVIFGPLLVIFLVGMSFNTSSLYDLKIATYSDAYSELSNSIIAQLQDEQYSTIKTDTAGDCIEGVKLGKFHVCAIFSPNMVISNEVSNSISIYVDESRMNLANLIEGVIQRKVAKEAMKISESLAGDVISTMFATKDILQERKDIVLKLLSTNSDQILKVKGLKEDIDAVKLELNETVNYTMVRRAVDELKSEYNTTIAESEWEPVEESLNYLKIAVDEIVAKIKKFSDIRKGALNDLDGMNTNMQTATEDLTQIKVTLNSLVSGIEGVEVTDVGTIVSPVKTSVESVTSKKTHLGYLFPTFIILIVMFISILLSSTITVREKLSKAFFRNFIMPTNDVLFMFGAYLTNILIVGLQLAVLFGAALYFLPDIQNILGNMVLMLLIIATVFILIGMFIGFIFKSEETATLGAISVGTVLLFFSNTILPIETLPIGIRDIAKYNPFVISESILKKILLFNVSLDVISLEIYMLLCFIIIFFILAFVAREVTKSRFR